MLTLVEKDKAVVSLVQTDKAIVELLNVQLIPFVLTDDFILTDETILYDYKEVERQKASVELIAKGKSTTEIIQPVVKVFRFDQQVVIDPISFDSDLWSFDTSLFKFDRLIGIINQGGFDSTEWTFDADSFTFDRGYKPDIWSFDIGVFEYDLIAKFDGTNWTFDTDLFTFDSTYDPTIFVDPDEPTFDYAGDERNKIEVSLVYEVVFMEEFIEENEEEIIPEYA